MRKLAKLTIFFSISFIVFFIVLVLLRFVSIWIDFARIIPLAPQSGEDFAETAWKTLPAALYPTILLTLSYTVRRNIPITPSIFCIIILGFGFTVGATLGISRTGALKPILKPVSPIDGAPGLIVSQSDNAIVLLKKSSEIWGPRVVSLPARPLIYQEIPLGPNNTILHLPALSFGNEAPWFIRSVEIDFSLCAGALKSRFETDFTAFIAYACALILLLGSLRFVLELSQWPLASIFFGALVFRGILALEVFLNSREINNLIGSYLAGRVPPIYITPVVFASLGFLVILYTFLTRLARPGRST